MDRGTLSDSTVIKASREFVCARLATYEDKEEGKLLKGLFRTRSGELENTVFCILSPDGRKSLVRAGRSPDMSFRRSGGDLVESMNKIAKQYKAKKGARTVPTVKNLRLAINVAACDNLPLAIIVGKQDEKALAAAAWKEELAGKVIWVRVFGIEALKTAVKKAPKDAGLVIAQPDAFGLRATVLASTKKDYAKAVAEGIKKHKAVRKDTRSHIREGRSEGVHWDTEIPVTDPGIPPGGHGRR